MDEQSESAPALRQRAAHEDLEYIRRTLDAAGSFSSIPGRGLVVIVSDLVSGGPAERAGVHQRDVITQIDSEKVSSANELVDHLSRKEVGDMVTLHVLREGRARTIEIRLGSPLSSPGQSVTRGGPAGRDQESTAERNTDAGEIPSPQMRRGVWRLGVQVAPLDRDLDGCSSLRFGMRRAEPRGAMEDL